MKDSSFDENKLIIPFGVSSDYVDLVTRTHDIVTHLSQYDCIEGSHYSNLINSINSALKNHYSNLGCSDSVDIKVPISDLYATSRHLKEIVDDERYRTKLRYTPSTECTLGDFFK